MPEFLAETYTPWLAPGIAAPCAADVARAAEHASGPGAAARFLGAVAVPEEETCFWLYQAPRRDHRSKTPGFKDSPPRPAGLR